MFFSFLQSLIFRVLRGVKGQKTVQNDKKFCLSHLIFQESNIIWSSFMVQMYVLKDNISRHLFIYLFIYFKILIIRILRGGNGGWEKGQKMAQDDKKFSLSRSVSQEPYIIWFSFLVHVCKMMISLVSFFMFQNFVILGVFREEKGRKWPKITNFSLFCSISQEL